MDVTEKENGATVLIIKVRLDPKKLVNDTAISNFKGGLMWSLYAEKKFVCMQSNKCGADTASRLERACRLQQNF